VHVGYEIQNVPPSFFLTNHDLVMSSKVNIRSETIMIHWIVYYVRKEVTNSTVYNMSALHCMGLGSTKQNVILMPNT
jgi:hypothetical protein